MRKIRKWNGKTWIDASIADLPLGNNVIKVVDVPIFNTDIQLLANQLLSHSDRDVRDLALFVHGHLKEKKDGETWKSDILPTPGGDGEDS